MNGFLDLRTTPQQRRAKCRLTLCLSQLLRTFPHLDLTSRLMAQRKAGIFYVWAASRRQPHSMKCAGLSPVMLSGRLCVCWHEGEGVQGNQLQLPPGRACSSANRKQISTELLSMTHPQTQPPVRRKMPNKSSDTPHGAVSQVLSLCN